jgi:endo-1,4-beta-xylanase
MKHLCILLSALLLLPAAAQDATAKKKKKKKPPPFAWVNPLPESRKIPGVEHHTFKSPSMKVDVGYCIYLPDAYHKQKAKRFPVVYYLHGGRPGNETKSVNLAWTFAKHMKAGDVPPMIYVFVNGGAVSHYNYPAKDSLGADVFVKELIPHVDRTYRTIAERRGRALEGFSQGGRGTTRIMFNHPELFCSASPGGSGYETEKRISEEDGRESEKVVFLPGENAYDRARKYAKNPTPKLPILVHVGTKGFNYENNLAYMKFLDELGIPYEKAIAADAVHSAKQIYDILGARIMKFHADNFATK